MGLVLLLKIASLFLIILVGYLLVRFKLLKAEHSRVISVMNLYVFIPASLVSAFQVESSEEIRSALLLSFSSGILVHLVMMLVTRLLRKPLNLSREEQTSVIYSNSGNLMIPLVGSLLGPEWIVFTCGYTCPQIFFIWSQGKSLLSGDKHLDIKKILLNANMIAIIVGLFLLISGLSLPSFMQDAVDSLAACIAPAVMLGYGMMMAGMDLKKTFSNMRVLLMCALRLLLMPIIYILVVWLTGIHRIIPNGDLVLMVSMMSTAAPSAAMVTQMVQIYGGDADHCCAINVVSTLLCIITLPLMVTIYQFLIL